MAKKPVKLVFRSKPIIIVLVMVLLIGATIGVVAMNTALEAGRERYEELRQQAAALEADNAELSDNIASLGSIESVVSPASLNELLSILQINLLALALTIWGVRTTNAYTLVNLDTAPLK